ncbi:ATP F0F1 synthase subunit B [Rickettsiaceae bacterium]|nr:ATP F0F1 synthase subunit B [Rickettsiaceae bacterium]
MIHFLDESFVVAVCFIIFIYLAYRPVKKAIVASLDARINEIKQKLAETEKLKQDAKLMLSEIEQEMAEFEERKKEILESAKNSTQRLVETKAKEMDLLLARKKDSAIKSIENERVKASNTMRAEFTDTVLNMVRSYLIETKNNSTSDEEILNHFIKK